MTWIVLAFLAVVFFGWLLNGMSALQARQITQQAQANELLKAQTELLIEIRDLLCERRAHA